MKKNGLKKKNMIDGYMGGGNPMMPKAPMSSMYRMGGKLYMGGGNTKTDNTMSYKDDVQKRFGGGGMTDQPAMKKKNMRGGGMMGVGKRGFVTQSSMSQPNPTLPRGKKGKGDI